MRRIATALVCCVILGTVVVFEIAGPILLRLALLRAGEIPVSQAIHHSTTTPIEGSCPRSCGPTRSAAPHVLRRAAIRDACPGGWTRG